MKNYFDKLDKKVSHYKNKYPTKPRKVAAKLAFWNAKCIFKKELISSNKNTFVKQSDKINIAFCLGGGIGDIIIGAVYISKFIEKIDIPIEISIFVGQSVKSVKDLLHGTYNNIQSIKEYNEYTFDMTIRLEVQFPRIVYKDNILAEYKSKFLHEYIKSVECFNAIYENILYPTSTALQQAFLQINKKTRLSGMDITGQLELTSDSSINLTIPQDGLNILEKYNLKNKKFITVQRGVDVNNSSSESVRLWSLGNYSKLVNYIKLKYPDYLVIQLGVSKERCGKIDNIDIDLRGKTTFAEVLALLNNSMLHIDCECGMVHIRHFLCKKTSVVLFGPTSDITKGYNENINIRTNACNCYLCEWIIGEKWQEICPNIQNQNICMKSITPKMVMDKIDNYFNNQKENNNA